jgi:fructosamine-3-kinase
MKLKETEGNNDFHEGPKLSEHEVDKKFNERRVNLLPQVKDFVSNHLFFKDKKVKITFSHKGVSSLVCLISSGQEKFILKIPLSLTYSLGEGTFLKVWEQAGVKVPHVYEEGVIGDHSYVLMEYVDMPTLEQKYSDEELNKKGIIFQMGQTLRAMHKPEARGYGRLINGNAEFSKFSDWVSSEDMQKRFQYVKENNLLNEEHGSLSIAIQILTDHADKEKNTSYCHDDFGKANIFATNPITVFDPNPRFNNRYFDLGRSISGYLICDGLSAKQFIDGYFGKEKCDEKVLHAVILISSYMKFPYAHKTKKLDHIERVQKYLAENRHLLEN